MTATLVSLYEDGETADKVVEKLIELGCDEDNITVLEAEEEEDGDIEDEVSQVLLDREFAEEKARSYAKAVKNGQVIVVVDASDDIADEGLRIMERYEGGESESEEEAGETTTAPVVQEELKVGKRTTSGSVRARREVTEQPEEKSVRLRQEQVDVDRQPTDRKLRDDEKAEAFKETSVEIPETREEAVVGKEARVVEEVTLRKQAEEREEKVRDTVRRSDVKVERDEPKSPRRDQ
jgi:uncharacterized protein (TIGR02271 family)